ncbi:MAG: DNA cytosine methyltransferase [Clostridium sp.]|nr:DNA cytosine methyltransferase [Clostridium sp.]
MKLSDLIIDCFAGGGGASVGIEMALGRGVDIAINHDPMAIKMHEFNHPNTYHYTEDIMKVKIKDRIRPNDRVRFMWASPDCTQHSRAKGGKPVEKGLRILPYGVRRLCVQIYDVTGYLPEVVIMENVAEIQDWGPLDENNKPIKSRKGEDYKKFIDSMKLLGYEVESKELVAADYGVPTTRKRWFAIFRSDGREIVWPEQTHSKDGLNGLKKWVPVSSVLDFKDLGKSIFGRKKPLAEKTMKRTAGGLGKFVFEDPNPFMFRITGTNYTTPYIMQIGQTGFSEYRNRKTDKPLSTIVTKNEHCLISPYAIQYHSETSDKPRGQSVNNPLQTIDTSNRYGLVAAWLEKFYKTGLGQTMMEPIHTITTSPGHFGQVSVLMVDWEELKAAGIEDETLQKCTWVSQFIMEYYGTGIGQSLNLPLHTIVTKDRFALISVCGNEYCIVDIFLRMLNPEELKLAQGFPRDYIIDRYADGTAVSISERVRRIGNSVCPGLAKALTYANVPYLKVGERMPNLQIKQEESGQMKFA